MQPRRNIGDLERFFGALEIRVLESLWQRRQPQSVRDLLPAFESVAYRYEPGPEKKGYLVTFEVADIQQVYPLRFERLPVPEAELRSVVRRALPLFGDRVPGTKETIELARRTVEDYLKTKGHNEPVSARVISDRPDDLYISIHPAAAPPVVAAGAPGPPAVCALVA